MFQPIQHGIERCGVERQGASRAAVDLQSDVVSVTRLYLELGQHKELAVPFFQKLSSAPATI